MSREHSAVPGSSGPLLLALTESLPAVVALAAVLVADALLRGWIAVVVMGACIVGMFGAFAYRDRTPRGAARKAAWERFGASLDPIERRVGNLARYAPFAVAVVVGHVTGSAGAAFALTVLGTFVVLQVAFALWLRVRRAAV